MRKSKISDSYESLSQELEKVYAERSDQLFWEFEYSRRHLHRYRFAEVDELLDPIGVLVENHGIVIIPDQCLQRQLNIYVCNLVYAWHRKTVNDGFIDLRYELALDNSMDIIESLNQQERKIIKKLHALSVEYGFFVIELCSTRSMQQVIEDLKENCDKKMQQPMIVFPKQEPVTEGVEIFTFQQNPKSFLDWGIAAYINLDDKLSAINKKLDELWDAEEKVSFGDADSCQMSIFINQKECISKYHTKDIIKLQFENLREYISGEEIIATLPPIPEYEGDDAVRKHRKRLASAINQIRAASHLVHRSWGREKGNIRRAIGLLLWDKLYKGTENKIQVIKDLINEFPDETFDYYHKLYSKNYNRKSKLQGKDMSSIMKTVERELYRDYELADRCISDRKVHQLSHIKGKSKS